MKKTYYKETEMVTFLMAVKKNLPVSSLLDEYKTPNEAMEVIIDSLDIHAGQWIINPNEDVSYHLNIAMMTIAEQTDKFMPEFYRLFKHNSGFNIFYLEQYKNDTNARYIFLLINSNECNIPVNWITETDSVSIAHQCTEFISDAVEEELEKIAQELYNQQYLERIKFIDLFTEA